MNIPMARIIAIHTITMNDPTLSLLQLFDPLFPIGSFTMSNGLETYVSRGIIYDAATLEQYLEGMLYILPYSDLGFAAKAALNEDIRLLDNMCTASKTPYELRQSSIKLCSRFLKNICEMEDIPSLKEYRDGINEGTFSGCYPVAAGLCIGFLSENISQGLSIYCYSLLSAAVNHAVKLVPLRQTDGQKVLHQILKKIPSAVETAVNCDISELGSGGFGYEFRSMQHETLYTRIYIS